MEESAQRRERLKAMRMEASQAATSNDAEGSTVFHGLSNPLLETSAAQGQVESCAPHRFDYYTDPMSAFSGTKTRSKVSPQISQDYSTPPRLWKPEVIPSPAPQPQLNYSPGPRMQPPQVNYSPGPRMQPPQGYYGNAVDMMSPTPGFYGSGGTPNYPHPSNSPRGGNFPSPGFVRGSSTSFNSGQGRGHQLSNSPHPGFGQEGSPSLNSGQGRGYFTNSPRPGFGQEGNSNFNSGQGRGYQFGNSPRPDFRQEGSPSYNSGQGRGPMFNNSPVPGSGQGGFSGFREGYSSSPNSRQGRGQWFSNNNSPGPNSGRGRGRWSGQSGGRGRGSHNHVSAEDRPDLFYNKSMVEDPWKPLKPVIWKTVTVDASSMNASVSRNSWLPQSIATKRAKVVDAPSQTSSQPSLAEYLAASFNEAADHEPSS